MTARQWSVDTEQTIRPDSSTTSEAPVMIAVVTILCAFPLGFFLRNRLTAAFVYATAYLWSYTFQTAYLTRGWVDGEPVGFRRPADFGADYGLVTAAIFIVGFGLVALGHRLGSRRRARKGVADLDPAPLT